MGKNPGCASEASQHHQVSGYSPVQHFYCRKRPSEGQASSFLMLMIFLTRTATQAHGGFGQEGTLVVPWRYRVNIR